jgi:hypothetical protein
MCGVYGWQFSKTPKLSQRAALASILGLYNDSRGGHSYGWLAGAKVTRGLGDIAPVALSLCDHTTVMAHTRFGTHGEKNVANAHPFEMVSADKKTRLVGAHNGVIQDHTGLNKKHRRDFAVDSQHIFQHLLDGLPLKDIEGYGTIEYVKNGDSRRVYLCRLTDSGALAVAKTDYGTVWSSDTSHLSNALTAAGIDFKLMEVKAGRLHYVEHGVMYITDAKMALSEPRWPKTIGFKSSGNWRNWGDASDFEVESKYDDKVYGEGRDHSDYATKELELDDPWHAYESELRHDTCELTPLEFQEKYGQSKFDALKELDEERKEQARLEEQDLVSEDPEVVNRFALKAVAQ